MIQKNESSFFYHFESLIKSSTGFNDINFFLNFPFINNGIRQCDFEKNAQFIKTASNENIGETRSH